MKPKKISGSLSFNGQYVGEVKDAEVVFERHDLRKYERIRRQKWRAKPIQRRPRTRYRLKIKVKPTWADTNQLQKLAGSGSM